MIMLKNKVALISGGGRGIGYAISRLFAEEGAIVYAGVRNTTDIDKVKYEDKSGGEIRPIFLDVCNKDSIKECALTIKKECGIIDILVNNAGITLIEKFEMMRDSSVQKIYDTNVFGVMHLTQMIIKLLKKSSSPVIINMSSIMAADSDLGQTAYASSKAAVESMTKTWAKEYASQGVRVNAIAPGNVDTDMFNIIDGKEMDDAVLKIGMKRVANPKEIAMVALFLASDMSSYVTGETIGVNGGLLL